MTRNVASRRALTTTWPSRSTWTSCSPWSACGCRVSKTMASDSVEDIEIHLLLEALYRRYHYDFRHYAQASTKRRLKQARLKLGFHSFPGMEGVTLHDTPTGTRT